MSAKLSLWNLLFNSGRHLFLAKLGSYLILTKVGISLSGPFGFVAAWALQGLLGFVAVSGIFVIDLSLDALKEGMKQKDFDKAAKLAYEKTIKKVYDETEKAKIRKEYLYIISKIGTVGNGPKP